MYLSKPSSDQSGPQSSQDKLLVKFYLPASLHTSYLAVTVSLWHWVVSLSPSLHKLILVITLTLNTFFAKVALLALAFNYISSFILIYFNAQKCLLQHIRLLFWCWEKIKVCTRWQDRNSVAALTIVLRVILITGGAWCHTTTHQHNPCTHYFNRNDLNDTTLSHE